MIKEWEISNFNESLLTHLIGKTSNFLLDLSRCDSDKSSKLSEFEQFIYDIALFHFEKLNIIFDKTKHFIVFHRNIETTSNRFKPLLSTITYFDDSTNATMITNLDIEKFKYKTLDELEFCISFPKKFKHISFQGKYYYEPINLHNLFDFERIVGYNEKPSCLYIHLYDKPPTDTILFEHIPLKIDDLVMLENGVRTYPPIENTLTRIILTDTQHSKKINIPQDIFHFDFFDDLIYRKNKECLATVLKTIDQNEVEHHNSFLFKRNNFNIIKKIDEEYRIDVRLSKYEQIFVLDKYFQTDICSWCIYDTEKYAAENGGWTDNKLSLEKVNSVFVFIIHAMNGIIQKVKNLYCMDENVIIKVNNIDIVKDLKPRTNELDGDVFIHVALNSFQDCMMYFNDGPSILLDVGDIVICNKPNMNIILQEYAQKGTKYMMIISMNIYEH